MKSKPIISKIAVHVVLILIAAVMILPFIWMLLTAFKTQTEATALNPFVIFPSSLKFDNFKAVLARYDFVILYFNTFAMIGIRVVASTLFSAMAAYAFGRLEFPGRDFLFSLVLFQMMIPAQVFIIPQYLMVDALDMRNTIMALVFPGIVSAFGTFLLRQFFMGLPKSLEESAVLDGANIGQTFFSIMLPLAKSGLVALGIFTALFGYKELMWPMIINPQADKATLSSALSLIQGAYTVNYPQLMAAAVMATWPMILIYVVFQKHFIQGIASTGGKL
ncbi:carbohydrate ABC transporter permease [Fundicoccus ignavus]|uniref:ABC transporter permease subunit n=2 Tax=Fundicoccus ignavus TaxID=2664442 RepID=A0A844CA95_9LACT|nr:carbohydrate ABC transporter permease [Fundicoccus ignavus]MRJ46090.1 ABC transporter permease subunit [Fundicoccus ignavus]